MKWREVKSDRTLPSEPRHQSDYFVKNVDLTKFGATWGKNTTGFRLGFSIYKRGGNSSHVEEYPYQLLINDGSGGYGHIYLKTLDEGKEIAEKIVEEMGVSDFDTVENPYAAINKIRANKD